MTEVRSLSFHASYQCRHSGACCTSGWPIPIEADRLGRLRAAIASGALRTSPATTANSAFVEPEDAPSDAPALLATTEERCIFYDRDARRCAVQRALGHDALPLACRQFPRVSVRDPRGVSVTLSHYCPTAAALLESASPVAIVIDAPAFPAGGEYVGLDATASLPPLLREDMLMDWESSWEWERLSVELLTTREEPPEASIGRLSAAVESARTWRPADGPLIDRVRAAFDVAQRASVGSQWLSGAELSRRLGDIIEAMPADLRAGRGRDHSRAMPSSETIARLLAAHAFANWTAHLGDGLRTWLRSLEAPLVLIRSGMDVRTTDLWLRHLAAPRVLASTWRRAE